MPAFSAADCVHPERGLATVPRWRHAGRGRRAALHRCVLLPAELPGAPSNLVISNISPRTATLRFRPGPDGKTSISQWIVEGQVRVSGAASVTVGGGRKTADTLHPSVWGRW